VIAFEVDLQCLFYCICMYFNFFYLFHRKISEMRWPIGVKFCTMVSSRPNFIMPVALGEKVG